jgi:branched-chain amino acid transport system substrate-binding protein
MKVNAKWVLRLFCWALISSNVCQAAVSGPPIVIGATVSMEGRYLEPSMMIQKAFQFWVDEVNGRDGLLGRKVELVLYDDKSQRALAKALYKKLIEQDKVDLVFSPYSTPLTLAASEVSEAHKMVMLACAAAGEKPWQKGARYLFGLYAPANRQFIGLLDMMAKQNFKTLSVLYDDTSSFNRDIMSGVQEWARIFRINIVYQQAYRDGEKELAGLLAEVKSKDANGLILSAYPPDCYELLRLLKKENYRPPVLAMPIVPVHPDFQKRTGDLANHVFGPSQWEPDARIPFPGTRRFVEGFKKFTGHLPSFHAGSAYAACQLYEQAITHTQSFDHHKLRDYIASLDTVTVIGRFKVDHTGKQVGHNSIIIQWQNGKKEIVWPQKMQTAQPLY